MRCPYCKAVENDKVIDSRLTEGGDVIRRRRVCQSCKKRFTTKERVEADTRLMVIKRDGARVPFDRSKMLSGVQRACYKRPLDEEVLSKLVEEVEDAIFKRYDREVSSQVIGSMLSERLRDLDNIAYIRFASVYRRFEDLGEFLDEVKEIMERDRAQTPGQGKLFEVE